MNKKSKCRLTMFYKPEKSSCDNKNENFNN